MQFTRLSERRPPTNRFVPLSLLLSEDLLTEPSPVMPSRRELRLTAAARFEITKRTFAELGLLKPDGTVNQEAKSAVFFTALNPESPVRSRISAIVALAKIYDSTLHNHDLVRLTVATALMIQGSSGHSTSLFTTLSRTFTSIGDLSLHELGELANLQLDQSKNGTICLNLKS